MLNLFLPKSKCCKSENLSILTFHSSPISNRYPKWISKGQSKCHGCPVPKEMSSHLDSSIGIILYQMCAFMRKKQSSKSLKDVEWFGSVWMGPIHFSSLSVFRTSICRRPSGEAKSLSHLRFERRVELILLGN